MLLQDHQAAHPWRRVQLCPPRLILSHSCQLRQLKVMLISFQVLSFCLRSFGFNTINSCSGLPPVEFPRTFSKILIIAHAVKMIAAKKPRFGRIPKEKLYINPKKGWVKLYHSIGKTRHIKVYFECLHLQKPLDNVRLFCICYVSVFVFFWAALRSKSVFNDRMLCHDIASRFSGLLTSQSTVHLFRICARNIHLFLPCHCCAVAEQHF